MKETCERITKKMRDAGHKNDYIKVDAIDPDPFYGFTRKKYAIDFDGGYDGRFFDSLRDVKNFLDGFELALDLYVIEE